MQERFGIAAFRSRQQALRLEAALKKEGLPVRMISTPRGEHGQMRNMWLRPRKKPPRTFHPGQPVACRQSLK